MNSYIMTQIPDRKQFDYLHVILGRKMRKVKIRKGIQCDMLVCLQLPKPPISWCVYNMLSVHYLLSDSCLL